MKFNIRNSLLLFVILVFIFSTLLIGCSDKSELKEISVVVGIGIDKMPGDEPIRVTAEIINPKIAKTQSDSSEKIGSSIIKVSTGKSIFDAVQNFSKISSLIMDFSHVSVIILSKDLCESGVSEVIDYLNREREFRSTNWLLISTETAKEILESRIPNEDITSTGIQNMMNQLKKNPSILPVSINDFVIESESESKSSFAPIIDLEKSKDNTAGRIKIENTAIFKNNHLLGVLTIEESKSLLWLSDTSKGHMSILPFESDKHNKNVTVEVFKKSSKIIPHLTEDGFYFEIECTGEATLKELQNTNMSTEVTEKIEHNTEIKLEKQLNELINKSQKDFNSDFVGFSKKIYNNYPKKWLLIKTNWNEIFPNIKYIINFKINLTNGGLIKNPAITGDKEENTK